MKRQAQKKRKLEDAGIKYDMDAVAYVRPADTPPLCLALIILNSVEEETEDISCIDYSSYILCAHLGRMLYFAYLIPSPMHHAGFPFSSSAILPMRSGPKSRDARQLSQGLISKLTRMS